jgi:hypothetical protein
MIAMKGSTKCRRHGGKSLSGALSPGFKHGRYSKHLPTRLAARALEGLANPRLLSMVDNIAVSEAHLAELFEALETGESGATWQALQEALGAFRLAQAARDAEAMETHFRALEALIRRGTAREATWQAIERAWEVHGKMVKTETDTMLKLQQFITVQQAMAVQAAQTEAVIRAVGTFADPQTGRKILAAIQRDFDQLATQEGR